MASFVVSPTKSMILHISVTRDGVGGLTGLLTTVALRRAETTNSYLDWSDYQFKTSGWTTRDFVLTETDDGQYGSQLDATLLDVDDGDILVAEYNVSDSGDPLGIANDTYTFSTSEDTIELLRKHLTNRLEEAAGNPGSLVLYDDDDVSPIKTWELRDGTGGAVGVATGSPARRSRAT